MKKVFVESVTGSGDIWGYNAIVIPLTEANMAELVRLKEAYLAMKAIDPSINGIVYDNPKLDIELFGENFDGDSIVGSVIEMSHEEYHDNADISANDCTLESPYIEVREDIIRIICEAEHEHANIMAEFNFSEIFKEEEA